MPDTTATALAPHPASYPAAQPADIVRELGPFEGATSVAGVTWDGTRVWAATGTQILAIDPDSGEVTRRLPCAADAGTAFDGRHLWQIAESRIHKIDPDSGAVLASIPAPGNGTASGLTWAEGSLWVGDYRGRQIHQVDPETGALRRSIESNRFVTGVTWADGELWHGTWEGDESELRHVDAESGRVLQRVQMPAAMGVSGLEAGADGLLYAGGGGSGKVRVVKRAAASRS